MALISAAPAEAFQAEYVTTTVTFGFLEAWLPPVVGGREVVLVPDGAEIGGGSGAPVLPVPIGLSGAPDPVGAAVGAVTLADGSALPVVQAPRVTDSAKPSEIVVRQTFRRLRRACGGANAAPEHMGLVLLGGPARLE
jgi:hypothetical protein